MRSLTLASWNIRKCVGLDWRRDPSRVARVLTHMRSDVVALQEVDKRLGFRPAALPHDVVANDTHLTPVPPGSHPKSLGWHGNAVLLGGDLEAEAVEGMELPGIEPRGALFVDIAGEGVRLRVVAVHLGLLRRSRRLQLAAIRDRLARLDDRPTVILGDFNEWSPRAGLEPLQGFDVHAPGLSFHSSRPVAALDRIVTDPRLVVEKKGVVRNEDTVRASDHLPIWARIAAADASARAA